MHLRIRHGLYGGHIHVELFVGTARDVTHASAGHIALDIVQWTEFKQILIRGQSAAGLEFVDELVEERI